MVHSYERISNNYSVPLAFDEHYFVLESGPLPQISVIGEFDGCPIFEVYRNNPILNLLSEPIENAEGIVTMSDRHTGRFLYSIHLGPEINIGLGKIDGGVLTARITDNHILVGDHHIDNHEFNGASTGIIVDYEGRVRIEEIPIPPALRQLLVSRNQAQ